jgi:DNA-binding NarL/FixJ family response regulator
MIAGAKDSTAAALGAAKYEVTFEAGRRLSREAAVRLALGESESVEVVGRGDVGTGTLAKRELEVARLIADGLSNKQIGARLFISDATVASHIRHIMDKLGVNARSQIAVWVASLS